MSSSVLPLIAGACLLCAACEPTNLYIAHRTVVGVNAALNTEKTAGNLTIGYDRNFVAIVPKSVPINGKVGKEAMTALACSELKVSGIFISRFDEYVATGEAAKTYAETIKSVGGDKIFGCFDDR